MERTLSLIEQSPSTELLVPLVVALQKELGQEPKVAREIEEVAEDIRKELHTTRPGKDVIREQRD